MTSPVEEISNMYKLLYNTQTELVAELRKQIAYMAKELDAQRVSFHVNNNKLLSERDTKINYLSERLRQQEEKIVDLLQQIAEADETIASLREMNENQMEIILNATRSAKKEER